MSAASDYYSDLALEHGHITAPCMDHTVEACSCGDNDPERLEYGQATPDHDDSRYVVHLREVFAIAAQHEPGA